MSKSKPLCCDGGLVRDDEERTWEDVERLLNDLKADGYDPILLQTATSAAVPEKSIQINVERDSDTESDHSE